MENLTTRDRIALAKRSPRRVSVTVSYALHQRLLEVSDYQGRSASNLCAHLLELALPDR